MKKQPMSFVEMTCRDSGLSEAETRINVRKVDLLLEIHNIADREHLTIASASKLTGVSRAKMSAIMSGDYGKVSTDELELVLAALQGKSKVLLKA